MLWVGVLLRTFSTLCSAFLAISTSIKLKVSKSGNYYAKQSSVIKCVSVVNGIRVDKRGNFFNLAFTCFKRALDVFIWASNVEINFNCMQKNPLKNNSNNKTGSKFWDYSLRDAALWGLFCNSNFECHSFVFKFGTLCGTSRTFTFSLPSCHDCFPMSSLLFHGIDLPTHSYRANQAVCSGNTLQSAFPQCGFPPWHLPVCSGLLVIHSLLLLVLWLCPPWDSFIVSVTNDAETSVKCLETFQKYARNEKSLTWFCSLLASVALAVVISLALTVSILLTKVPSFYFLCSL